MAAAAADTSASGGAATVGSADVTRKRKHARAYPASTSGGCSTGGGGSRTSHNGAIVRGSALDQGDAVQAGTAVHTAATPATPVFTVVDPLWVDVSLSTPAAAPATPPPTEGAAPVPAARAVPTEGAVPPLRFFVGHEDEFERLYEQASAEVHWERVLGGTVTSTSAAPT